MDQLTDELEQELEAALIEIIKQRHELEAAMLKSELRIQYEQHEYDKARYLRAKMNAYESYVRHALQKP